MREALGAVIILAAALCWQPADTFPTSPLLPLASRWPLHPPLRHRPPDGAHTAMASASADADSWVQSAVLSNRLGVLMLNRPKALNAADQHVTSLLLSTLHEWERDEAVRAVLVRSTSERAFCSGGDVKAIATDLRADPSSQTPYTALSNEYRLLCRLQRWAAADGLDVPSIAIMDGVTMGFGVGLGSGARYRVVTERTLLAMPENAIGLFPDIGFAYLMRDQPCVGLYLALTGTRIGAKASPSADIISLGLGTHYVPSESLPALVHALEAADLGGSNADSAIQAILADFAQECPDACSFDALKPKLARCFNPEDKTCVRDIISSLEKEAAKEAAGEPSVLERAARAALDALATGAPMSLELTLAHFRDISIKLQQGKAVLLPEVLTSGNFPPACALQLRTSSDLIPVLQAPAPFHAIPHKDDSIQKVAPKDVASWAILRAKR